MAAACKGSERRRNAVVRAHAAVANVADAHSHGVIHGDLRPDTIVVTTGISTAASCSADVDADALAAMRESLDATEVTQLFKIMRQLRDDQAANHAGNSVWADEQNLYVGLNESFIGVCFETKADVAEGGEQLTEAQVLAGRLLTQVLRSRYQIDDALALSSARASRSAAAPWSPR